MVIMDEAVGTDSKSPIPDVLPDLPSIHTLVKVGSK